MILEQSTSHASPAGYLKMIRKIHFLSIPSPVCCSLIIQFVDHRGTSNSENTCAHNNTNLTYTVLLLFFYCIVKTLLHSGSSRGSLVPVFLPAQRILHWCVVQRNTYIRKKFTIKRVSTGFWLEKKNAPQLNIWYSWPRFPIHNLVIILAVFEKICTHLLKKNTPK